MQLSELQSAMAEVGSPKKDEKEISKRKTPPSDEDWCKNCPPDLPSHKHQPDGSCNILRANSTVHNLNHGNKGFKKFWCRKCNPNLPPHQHQEDGSCLVKTAEGAEEFQGLTISLRDGTERKIYASKFFESGLAPFGCCRPFHPMADMEALHHFLIPAAASRMSTGALTSDENFDIQLSSEI